MDIDGTLIVSNENGLRRVDIKHNLVSTLFFSNIVKEVSCVTIDRYRNLYVGCEKEILKLEPKYGMYLCDRI